MLPFNDKYMYSIAWYQFVIVTDGNTASEIIDDIMLAAANIAAQAKEPIEPTVRIAEHRIKTKVFTQELQELFHINLT